MGFHDCFLILYIVFVMQSLVTGEKPSELEVSLDKENGKSSIYFGQTDDLVITIKVPHGVTEDVTVLFMASLTSTVFAIGNISEYTVGSDITSASKTTWFDDVVLTPGPEYTNPNLKIYYNTLASFDLGTITNYGTSYVEANSYITIKCEIVLVSLGTHSAGETYLPSVALAHANYSVVLVSREIYTLYSINSGFPGSSSIVLSSITTLEDNGKIINSNVTLSLIYSLSDLEIVSSVINQAGSVSPVKIELVSVGEAYSYSVRKDKVLATKFEDCPIGKMTSPSLVLYIGNIVNKAINAIRCCEDGMWESSKGWIGKNIACTTESQKGSGYRSSERNGFVFRISWLVFETTALGKSFDLKVTTNRDGRLLYTETNTVTVVTRSPPAASLTVISAAPEGSSLVPAGSSCSAVVTMETPPGSLHTYAVDLVTRSKNESESRLMILSSTFDAQGDNLPCPAEELSPFNATYTDSKNPHITNKASMSFAVLNTGGVSGNQLKFKVKMLAMDDAVIGSIYELLINVSGSVRTVEYTVDDPIQNNVNFTAVADSTDKVKVGGFGTARVTIHTTVETAVRYTVKLLTRESSSNESKLSIVFSEFFPNVPTSPYIVDNYVNLFLMNNDPINPSVQNGGNMSFSVINTGEYQTNDFEFVIKLAAHLDAVNDTIYELVVDINDVVKIAEFTVWGYFTLNTSFSVTHVGTDVISAGGKGKAEITIETVPESLQSFLINLVTREPNGTESKLILLSYTVNSSQENSPAILEDNIMLTTFGADAVYPYIKNAGNMTFSILNSGTQESNSTVLHIKMIALPDAIKDTVYKLVVDANGVNKSVEFTIGDPVPFNTSFTVTHVGTDVISAGGKGTAEIAIETIPESLQSFIINLTTRETNGTESNLIIFSCTVNSSKENSPAILEDNIMLTTYGTDAVNPYIKNAGNMTFSILNSGIEESNYIVFHVEMIALPDAIKDTVYMFVVHVNGVIKSVEFTIGDPVPSIVNFTAVAESTDKVKVGGFGTAKVTIHTTEETAVRYTVKLLTREKSSMESKLSIVFSEFFPNVPSSPYVMDNNVNLSLTNNDPTNPSVQNAGNMSFSVINTGAYQTDDFEFVIKLAAHLDAVNDTVYELVVDINDVVKVVEFTIWDYVTLNTSFSVRFVGTDIISAGGKGKAEIIIETIPESLQSFIINLITRETNRTESKLMLLSYTVNSSQENSPAILEDNIILTTYGTDAVNPYVKNAGNMTVSIRNSGNEESNYTVFHVELTALPNAIKDTVYMFVVDINGVNKTVEFTIGDPLPFNTSVAYKFSMEIIGDSSLAPGDEFDVIMNITTTPNTNAGPMSIVLPKPSGTSYIKFIEAKTEFQGKNVPCPHFGIFGYSLSSWNNTLQDNNKATVTVPYVCNIQTVNEGEEDLWQIRMKLQMTDHTDQQTTQQNVMFGVRVNFTDNPIYSQSLAVISLPPPSQSQSGQIKGTDFPHSDQVSTPWVWIAVGIAGLIVILAIATAACVMIRKIQQMNKTTVLAVAEYKDTGLPGKGIYCTN